MNRTAMIAVVAGLVWAGGASAQTAPPAPPLELERLAPGPLPGTQVRGHFRVPGVGAVRHAQRLLVAGIGARRATLLIARGGRDELCFAAVVGPRVRRALFTCLKRWDRPPLLIRAGVGGRSRARTEWMSLVGLVRSDVGAVVVQSQQGVISHPRLREWPGFPWKAYATPPAFRHRFPSTVWAQDASGAAIQDVDLGWAYGAACGQQGAPPCTPRRRAGSWSTVRDPITRAQTRFIEGAGGVRAKRLTFDNPIVRTLVAGQAFSIDTVAEWSRCNGRRIGAVVPIRLTKPIVFEGEVPVQANDDTNRSAYLEGVAHLRVENAISFDIYVDLNRRKVVSVGLGIRAPDLTGTKPPPPKVDFKLIGPLRPAGGPDSGDCQQRD